MTNSDKAQKTGKALGVGGVFFRSKDPFRLATWYRETLGLDIEDWGTTFGAAFSPDTMPLHSFTVWGAFTNDTEYFGKRSQFCMINLIVDDLDLALANVKASGAQVLPEREDYDYGRFGWVVDPDGNRLELWEPPETMPEEEL